MSLGRVEEDGSGFTMEPSSMNPRFGSWSPNRLFEESWSAMSEKLEAGMAMTGPVPAPCSDGLMAGCEPQGEGDEGVGSRVG